MIFFPLSCCCVEDFSTRSLNFFSIFSISSRLTTSSEKPRSGIRAKGKEQINTPSIQHPPEIKDFKLKSLGDLARLLDEKFKGFNASPLNLYHLFDDDDRKMKFLDEINGISEK